jgi:MFS transporter, ACS family, D-galactonate transporter
VNTTGEATISSSGVNSKATHVRWFPILFMVLIGTTINYLDRAVFGIARVGGMQEDLGLNAVQIGYLASAFSLTYAFAQIPGGIFLDRFGTRVTYGLSLFSWSLFTCLQGLATGFASMFGYRLGMGLCEAPCFPANSRILATWFPQGERARANSVYAVGQYAGLAFLSVPLVWITAEFGWRALFIIAGLGGILFAFYFYGKYHEPNDSKIANQAELDYIEAGGGLAPKTERVKFSWTNMFSIFKRRQIMVASIAMFCGNTVLVFFLLDFVNYLGTERDMQFLQAGIWAALPYMAAALGVLCGGQLSDYLLKRTGSANIGRKLPITLGFFMASTIMLAALVPRGEENNILIIGIMCVAFFGQGICNLGWTVISDVAPKELLGMSGGVFNFITNLAGILTPILIGYVLYYTASYNAALVYVGVMPLIGAFLYIFVLGDIKRLAVEV